MTRQILSSNSTFEQLGSYSRIVAQEPFCFLSGVTGYDYATMEISSDLVTQTHKIFDNIETFLKQAGFEFADITTMTCIITQQSFWQPVYGVMKERMSHVRPTLLTYVAGLIEPAMKVEIQAHAVRRHAQ